jgi:hypothetical protein
MAGSRSYSYDANGNVRNDGTRAYKWDGANRLSLLGDVSFRYGPDGARLKKTSPPKSGVPDFGTKYEQLGNIRVAAPPSTSERRWNAGRTGCWSNTSILTR